MYFKKMLRLIYYFIWAMISPSTEIDLIQLNLLFRKVRAQNWWTFSFFFSYIVEKKGILLLLYGFQVLSST